MPKLTAHPSHDELIAFGLGNLSPEQRAAMESHVAHCDACCRALSEVPDDTLVGRLRTADATMGVEPQGKPVVPEGSSAPQTGGLANLPPELVDHPRYRIVKALGSGGMGTVFLAEHRFMERRVALKVINRRLTSNSRAVERFRLEAKAAGKLSHPHIVTAYDGEQAGDLHFLVMEFVDGETLARVVEKRGPLSVANACMAARQAATGLQHACKQGMVHRDIKPQNLMLTRDGRRVKILDFGLARLAREHAQAETISWDGLATDDAGLTAAGMVLGTPDYIAPEQVQDSRHADIRADIYSLGCTLYFLLAGHAPFPQGSAAEKVRGHMREKPLSIAALRPEVPVQLVGVIERMMAKDPRDRYQTPDDVAQALEPFCKSAPTVAELPAMPAAGVEAGLDTSADVSFPTLAPVPLLPSRPVGRLRSHSGFNELLRRRPGVFAAGAVAAVVVVACVFALSQMGIDDEKTASGTASGKSVGAANSNGALERSPSSIASNETQSKVANAGRTAPFRGAPPGILLVIAHDNFWHDDLVGVRSVLEKAGCKIKVGCWKYGRATPHPGSANLWPGRADVETDVVLRGAGAKYLDAVVFIGELESTESDYEYIGNGPGAEQARQLIREMQQEGKFVTAICGGPMILADAGVLKGKTATGQPNTHSFLNRHGAKVVPKSVVELPAERIILGREPSSAREFAETLLRALNWPAS